MPAKVMRVSQEGPALLVQAAQAAMAAQALLPASSRNAPRLQIEGVILGQEKEKKKEGGCCNAETGFCRRLPELWGREDGHRPLVSWRCFCDYLEWGGINKKKKQTRKRQPCG